MRGGNGRSPLGRVVYAALLENIRVKIAAGNRAYRRLSQYAKRRDRVEEAQGGTAGRARRSFNGSTFEALLAPAAPPVPDIRRIVPAALVARAAIACMPPDAAAQTDGRPTVPDARGLTMSLGVEQRRAECGKS